jgi:hypothetical protein
MDHVQSGFLAHSMFGARVEPFVVASFDAARWLSVVQLTSSEILFARALGLVIFAHVSFLLLVLGEHKVDEVGTSSWDRSWDEKSWSRAQFWSQLDKLAKRVGSNLIKVGIKVGTQVGLKLAIVKPPIGRGSKSPRLLNL